VNGLWAETPTDPFWLAFCLGLGTMIVSALVLTTVGSTDVLKRSFESNPCVQFGPAEKDFVPVVTSPESLREAREVFERLQAHPGVADLQLVSWVDEDALVESTKAPAPTLAEEKQ
jgi:hypothetical protein